MQGRELTQTAAIMLAAVMVILMLYIAFEESKPQEPVLGVAEVYTPDPKVVRSPAVCTETVELRMGTGEGARCLKGSITAVSLAKSGTNLQRPVIRLTCTCS